MQGNPRIKKPSFMANTLSIRKLLKYSLKEICVNCRNTQSRVIEM